MFHFLRSQAVLEAQAWKSLEEGAEREIQVRQNVKLMEQEGVESIKVTIKALTLCVITLFS